MRMDISIGKDVIFLKGQAPTDYIDLNKGVTTEVMKNKTRLKKETIDQTIYILMPLCQ